MKLSDFITSSFYSLFLGLVLFFMYSIVGPVQCLGIQCVSSSCYTAFSVKSESGWVLFRWTCGGFIILDAFHGTEWDKLRHYLCGYRFDSVGIFVCVPFSMWAFIASIELLRFSFLISPDLLCGSVPWSEPTIVDFDTDVARLARIYLL